MKLSSKIKGTNLQKSSSEYRNETDFLCDLHLQLPYRNCRDNDKPDVHRGIKSCVSTRTIISIVLGTAVIEVHHKVASKRPVDKNFSEAVRQRQQHVQDLRPPEDPPERIVSRVENALVKEQDGRLAEPKYYGIQESSRHIHLQPYGHFPPI